MNDEVRLTASKVDDRYESQLETLKRINTVIGLLRENGHISTEIVGMHDHNGALTVTWKNQPGFGETQFLKELWKEVSNWEVVHQVAE